jgi:hypothetical protein
MSLVTWYCSVRNTRALPVQIATSLGQPNVPRNSDSARIRRASGGKDQSDHDVLQGS